MENVVILPPRTMKIGDAYVSLWRYGMTYAYSRSVYRSDLEKVEAELTKMGFEEIVIEPVMSHGQVVGFALSATKYPKEVV